MRRDKMFNKLPIVLLNLRLIYLVKKFWKIG